MAKKNLLGGFKFQKLPEISNGLMIPVGNDLRPQQVEAQTSLPISEPVRQAPKTKITRQPQNHNFGKINVDSQAFTPMTNVVPTIEGVHVPTNKPVIVPTDEPKFKGLSRSARQRVTHEDMNMAEYGALQSKQEKIVYLSLRGWSLKVETRGNALYHYATRYVNRKKKRLYIGAVSKDM
jgi:hypothetical protein